jgi:DNA-binding transcriptional LysR family regulator
MELKNLEILKSLVEDPHMSRTSDRFRMTQSALSKRLQNLESELGVRLFDRRGPRGLEPTPAARELARMAEQLLLSWSSGVRKLHQHQDEPEHFGIVGPQIFMREVLLPWWSGRNQAHPGLCLDVHVSALSRVSFELVQAGLDAGILEHQEDLSDFICKPVFTEQWGIVSHPGAALDPERRATLSTWSWCTLSSQTNPVDEWLVRRQKMAPPVYRLYWNDLAALAGFVAANPKTATVLPLHTCKKAVETGALRFTPLGKGSSRTLYLAWRRSHPHKKFIHELLKLGESYS